ncbi:hypothetical protein [Haloferax volcanii]|uniref:hypothetical protein n=1 Tax=Haloferax volcanii TaxID=2246 RepID=UPI001E3D7347|nr:MULTISPECIES: hypothetical protein [Haloferax]
MATTEDGGHGDSPTIVNSGSVEAQPFTGPFFKKIGKRKREERDAKILVTADHGQTGVGKTAAAVYLAKVLDTSATGFSHEKATLSVPEFLEMWDALEQNSAAILDEAEQIDARRAMRNENVDASMKFQTRRVNQIFAILTLPSPKEIDSRIERLADFWVNVECRGRARIYEKKIHRIKKSVYYETLQTFEWPNMDKDPDYIELARMKDRFINDDDADDNWVRQSVSDERIEKAVKDTRRELRDEWISALKDYGMAGTEIAKLSNVDLTSQRINQIAREN